MVSSRICRAQGFSSPHAGRAGHTPLHPCCLPVTGGQVGPIGKPSAQGTQTPSKTQPPSARVEPSVCIFSESQDQRNSLVASISTLSQRLATDSKRGFKIIFLNFFFLKKGFRPRSLTMSEPLFLPEWQLVPKSISTWPTAVF